MKTFRKWLSILLAAVLTLAMPLAAAGEAVESVGECVTSAPAEESVPESDGFELGGDAEDEESLALEETPVGTEMATAPEEFTDGTEDDSEDALVIVGDNATEDRRRAGAGRRG